MFNFIRALFKPKPVDSPLGWKIFALRHSDMTKADTTASVTSTPNLMRQLVEVNRRVNDKIKPRKDAGDTWTIWPEFGDCDDYAVTKRLELIKAGVPMGAVRIGVCKTETNEYHAVTVVVTSKGDYVLDNRRPDIREHKVCGYKWMMISTPDPMKWVSYV